MPMFTRRDAFGLLGGLGAWGYAEASQVSAPPRLSQLLGPPRLAPSWVAIGQKVLALGSNSTGGGVNTSSRAQFAIMNTGVDVTSIRVAFPNWQLNGGSVETVGANPITLSGSIQYPFGSFFRMTFDGATSMVLPAGATIWSDPIPIYVPKDTGFYIRCFLSVTSGQTWPRGIVPIVSNGDQSEEGVGLSDNTMGGSYSGSNGACYGPCAIIGMPAVPTGSVLLLTYSLGWGQGDDPTGVSSAPSGDGMGNYGPLQRGLYNAGIGFIKMTKSGLYARDVTGASVRTRLFAPFCGSAIVLLGTNDLTGNISLTAIQGYLTEIWAALAAEGCHVFACTVPPKTNSTDGWASSANQTMAGLDYGTGSSGIGSIRAQLNDWIRSVPNRAVFGVLELADQVETSRNSGVWKSGFTSDGTHWNQTGIPAIQSVIARAASAGLFV
jgi:hypothetical protein